MSNEINWALISQNAETNYTLLYNRNRQLEQANENLQAQLAKLCEKIKRVLPTLHADERCPSSITDTLEQAIAELTSSDAWMKEQKAKWIEEAAEWFDKFNYALLDCDDNEFDTAQDKLRRMAAELRSPESDIDQLTRTT